MLFGGAELPALWVVIFLAALAESALRYASWSKLEDELQGAERKDRYARYLDRAQPAGAACVVLRIAATAALVALITLGAAEGALGTLPALLAAAGLVVVAEAAGRLIGRKWSSGILRRLLPALSVLAWPLRLLGRRPADAEAPEPGVVDAAEEEIRVAIEDGAVEGALEAEQKQMIEGILKFRNVDVAEIMTPRTEMECLEADTPLAEAVQTLEHLRHSRIPVYEDRVDRIVGIAYVKDLLAAAAREERDSAPLREVAREPLFVPETKTVTSLLQQFRDDHVQIAIVLDEYGGVSGVVTVEDILEEIVGEIQDEYDQEDHENRTLRLPSGAVEIDGRVRVDEVNETFSLDLPEDESYDTVSGFVTARFARVPQAGEEFRTGGLLVRILQSDERRVRRVLIQRREKEA